MRVDGNGQFYIKQYFLGTGEQSFATGIYASTGLHFFGLSLKETEVIVYGGTNTWSYDIYFVVGHDSYESVDINGNGFYAKIKNYTYTGFSTGTNADHFPTGDYFLSYGCHIDGTSGTNIYTGFMDGFFHSFAFSGNTLQTAEPFAQFWTNECEGSCSFCPAVSGSCYEEPSTVFLAKMDFAAQVSSNFVSDASGNGNNNLLL